MSKVPSPKYAINGQPMIPIQRVQVGDLALCKYWDESLWCEDSHGRGKRMDEAELEKYLKNHNQP